MKTKWKLAIVSTLLLAACGRGDGVDPGELNVETVEDDDDVEVVDRDSDDVDVTDMEMLEPDEDIVIEQHRGDVPDSTSEGEVVREDADGNLYATGTYLMDVDTFHNLDGYNLDLEAVEQTTRTLNAFDSTSHGHMDRVASDLAEHGVSLVMSDEMYSTLSNLYDKYTPTTSGMEQGYVIVSRVVDTKVEQIDDYTFNIMYVHRAATSPVVETSVDTVIENTRDKLMLRENAHLERTSRYILHIHPDGSGATLEPVDIDWASGL